MLNSYYSSNVMIREFEPEVTQVKLEMGAQNSIVGENKTTLPPHPTNKKIHNGYGNTKRLTITCWFVACKERLTMTLFPLQLTLSQC